MARIGIIPKKYSLTFVPVLKKTTYDPCSRSSLCSRELPICFFRSIQTYKLYPAIQLGDHWDHSQACLSCQFANPSVLLNTDTCIIRHFWVSLRCPYIYPLISFFYHGSHIILSYMYSPHKFTTLFFKTKLTCKVLEHQKHQKIADCKWIILSIYNSRATKVLVKSYPITGTCFPISSKSRFAGTTIRSIGILTVRIGVADPVSSSTLVQIAQEIQPVLKINKIVLKTRKKVKIIALNVFFINRNTKISNLGKHARQNVVAMVTSSSWHSNRSNQVIYTMVNNRTTLWPHIVLVPSRFNFAAKEHTTTLTLFKITYQCKFFHLLKIQLYKCTCTNLMCCCRRH